MDTTTFGMVYVYQIFCMIAVWYGLGILYGDTGRFLDIVFQSLITWSVGIYGGFGVWYFEIIPIQHHLTIIGKLDTYRAIQYVSALFALLVIACVWFLVIVKFFRKFFNRSSNT